MVWETGVHTKDSEMVLDTQDYKVRIKGKVEQSREWSTALPYTLLFLAIEKGTVGSLSTKVTNFYW